MGKSKASTTVLHYAPEVLAMASSSSERIHNLLAICDYHSAALSQKTFNHKSDSMKEAQSLIRMVLSLQKSLDRYTLMLYPPTLNEVISTLPSSTEKREDEASAKSDTIAPVKPTEPISMIQTEETSEPLINYETETLEESVTNTLTTLSMSGEEALSTDSDESATDAWEETTLAKIDDLRQKILTDIETGKLSRRPGMEMIGDMEWRFKRTLVEKRAADQNKKSRAQWAAG